VCRHRAAMLSMVPQKPGAMSTWAAGGIRCKGWCMRPGQAVNQAPKLIPYQKVICAKRKFSVIHPY